MNFFRAVFTRHIFATSGASFFAVVTVYLVNRELETVWYERDFPVVRAREAEALLDLGQPFVAVSFDPGVWVTEFPETLRLRVSGSAKERAFFGTRPMIELRVRSQWVDDEGAQEHGLLESDFSIPLDLPSAKIVLLGEASLQVDRVEERARVRLELSEVPTMAAGQIYDAGRTRFDPPFVTVEGPSGIVRGLETQAAATENPLRVELDPAPNQVYRAGQSYAVRLSKAHVDRGLRIVEKTVTATLGAREEETAEVRLASFPVQWRLRDKDLKLLAAGQLALSSDASLECEVLVTGPASRMREFLTAEGKERLRGLITATVDPKKTIDELLPGDERGPSLSIEVSGLPAGLRAGLPGVKTVTCRISLLEKG